MGGKKNFNRYPITIFGFDLSGKARKFCFRRGAEKKGGGGAVSSHPPAKKKKKPGPARAPKRGRVFNALKNLFTGPFLG